MRYGARQVLAATLQAEVAAYVEQFTDQLYEQRRRLVVRNGYHDEREVLTAAGAVTVRAPRGNDTRVDPETFERQRFYSEILRVGTHVAAGQRGADAAEPARAVLTTPARRSSSSSARAWSCRRARSLGSPRSGRTRRRPFAARDLSGTDYVYRWVDGIHLEVRLEQEKLCILVMIGVRADGRKELVSLTDGFRESAESWPDLLRDSRCRGMTAPVLAVGDGAVMLLESAAGVRPVTREQRY